MPVGKNGVFITGVSAVLVTTIHSGFVSFPAAFVAITLKLCEPALVGVPDITPVVPFQDRPIGRLPPFIPKVIGAVPVALIVSL